MTHLTKYLTLALAVLAAGCGGAGGSGGGAVYQSDDRLVGTQCHERVSERISSRNFLRQQDMKPAPGTTRESIQLDYFRDVARVCRSLPPHTTVEEAAERVADEIEAQL